MKDFAKIIRAKDGCQIVIMRESSNDDGEHVSVTCQIGGGTCTSKLTFDHTSNEAERADKAFEEAERWAPQHVAEVTSSFGGMLVPSDES